MKKIFFALFSLSVIQSSAQEFKSYEKVSFGIGVEQMNYLDYDVRSQGIKYQLNFPIYQKLGGSFSFVNQSAYNDFCDDIPVSVTEKHFVFTLNYILLESNKWTIAALGGIDQEYVRYKEIPTSLHSPQLHNERAHETEVDDHNDFEYYTEVLVGAEVNFQLSNSFQLNFSSRLNSYASFRNSFSLFYLINRSK